MLVTLQRALCNGGRRDQPQRKGEAAVSVLKNMHEQRGPKQGLTSSMWPQR